MNKGEFSETYTLLKLLADGRVYSADQFNNKDPRMFLEVLRIIHYEAEHDIDFQREDVNVLMKINGELIKTIPAHQFAENAEIMYETLRNSRGNIILEQQTKDFLDSIEVKTYKIPAPSAVREDSFYYDAGNKVDIIMEIRDVTTGINSESGFSIKSFIGSNPTLFNCNAKKTRFVYKITGDMNDAKMNYINGIVDNHGHRDKSARMKYILDNLEIDFDHCKDENFGNILYLMHSDMEKVLALGVLATYKEGVGNGISDACNILKEQNPIGTRMPDVFYEMQLKAFLFHAFAGATATIWNGRDDINGGYIVVKKDGEVLAKHASQIEAFKDYLFHTNYFERPSVDENDVKHGGNYCVVYKENNEYYIDLNWTARFKSPNNR